MLNSSFLTSEYQFDGCIRNGQFKRRLGFREIEPTAASERVRRFYLCALRNEFNEGDEAGEPPTYHWVLSLEISSESSIMIDMVPGCGSDGLRGKIEVTALNERYTHEVLEVFSFDSQEEVKVRDVIELIQNKGRQSFTFSPESEGCRHWLSVVMADLDAASWIPQGSAMVAYEALLKYWKNLKGYKPRAMIKGIFSS
ncbi:hypothetical protein E0Z10_g4977 [Xylaria hypoxylon]|uniref:DUF7770 domain-containing protein n=1 Tax=Xylaria hypoxylon TaxID=37992 RepID=A0A4Z0YUX7_9PEZI|nr:hypothetical protein E0Z10_g4977 [Xylaria hypoxylon]